MRERLMSWTANHPVFANLAEDEQRHLAALLARCMGSGGDRTGEQETMAGMADPQEEPRK